MFTSTNPSPQPSPRLDGERVLFPFGACVKMHPCQGHLTFEQSPEHFINPGLQPGGWTPNSCAKPFQRLLQPRETR